MRIIFAAIFIITLLAIGAVAYLYASDKDPQQLRILACDWQWMSFETSSSSERSKADLPQVTNITGAGILGAQTQYVMASSSGGNANGLTGLWVMTVTAEVTLIKVPAAFVDYDQKTARYYVRTSVGPNLVDYKPPFAVLPKALNDSEYVVYQSLQPETITLKAANKGGLPGIGILANQPSYFGWNMRKGCMIEVIRDYDLISQQRNELIVDEECPEERQFATSADKANDAGAEWRFLSYDNSQEQRTLLIMPYFLEVQIPSFGIINNTEDLYLILARLKDESSGILQFTAKPLDTDTRFFLRVQSDDSRPDYPVMQIFPTTHQVSLSGPVGKLTVGLETTQTDEVSDVLLTYDDWPAFTWDSRTTIDEKGQVVPIQFLSGEGITHSVKVNGSELIKSRWDLLPAEIQGGLITAVVAAIVSIAVVAWETRRRSHPQTTNVFYFNGPHDILPKKLPRHQVQSGSLLEACCGLLVFCGLTLLAGLAWLWRVTQKPGK